MRTALVGAVLSGILQMTVAVSAQPALVSVATDGTPGNADSGAAVISGNGRVIAFASKATNLVPGDNNGSLDVFVRDTQTNVTTRVSVASDGTERQGDSGGTLNLRTGAILTGEISLSDDGSIVAFTSTAALVAEDTNNCPYDLTGTCRDIYVHDRTTGLTTRVSVASDGTQGDRPSDDPHLSADGRFVVFTSTASTLVPGDTSALLTENVFLHDRLTHTTTRVSMPRSGTQADQSSRGGRISADGQVIAFVSASTTLLDPAALPSCAPHAGPFCNRPYALDRTTGILEIVPVPSVSPTVPYDVQSVDLSANGRFVFVVMRLVGSTELAVFDRQTRRVSRVTSQPGVTTFAESGDGRTIASGVVTSTAIGNGLVLDRLTGLLELALPAGLDMPSLTTTGLQFVATGTLSPQTVPSVYLTKLDSDNDGIPDYWELTFGLNPNDPADASLDPDGDGLTNLMEYQQLGHPTGAFTRYLAEGAANAFFATRLAVFNPNDVTTNVSLRYLGSNGQVASSVLTLPARARETVFLEDATALPNGTVTVVGGTSVGLSIQALAPDNDFSTVIESDHQVVVDRTMFWDKSGYGSHAETAIASPGTTWYLAEGATHGAFDLFYLLQNPNAAEATVIVTYLRPAPLPPLQKTYIVAGQSRRTIWVDQEGPELAATDVAARITSDLPIIVERAMYYSTPSQPFAGGTDGAGLPATATRWFLAEGATGSFFDLFVLIANFESADTQTNLTYLLPDGTKIVKSHTIPANSRVTINVESEDGRLHDTAVSTIVESTNTVPIVVERAMWWPKGNWYEGHLAAGSTTTGTRWALAEGEFSRAAAQFPPQFPVLNDGTVNNDTDTYILIANTSASAGTATVTLYPSDGAPLVQTVPLPANSRVNVAVSVMFPGAVNHLFAAIVESDGPQIVVERAMYSNANGVIWTAGTSALATRLQ